MSTREPKHPITAKRNRSLGGVRGKLKTANKTIARLVAERVIEHAEGSKDYRIRVAFEPGVSRSVREEALRQVAAVLGARGGSARGKNRSKKELSEIGRKGAAARWRKARKR